MRYFNISEFDSAIAARRGNWKDMSPLFLDFIDELRARCDFPFRVTSGVVERKHIINL